MRYLGPEYGFCNIAEMDFATADGGGETAVPPTITAHPTNATVHAGQYDPDTLDYERKQPGLENFQIDWVCPEIGIRETVVIKGRQTAPSCPETPRRSPGKPSPRPDRAPERRGACNALGRTSAPLALSCSSSLVQHARAAVGADALDFDKREGTHR